MNSTHNRISRSPLIASILLTGAMLNPSHAFSWLEEARTREYTQFDGKASAVSDEEEVDRHGKITIRRIKPQNRSDWNTDPTALPYFFYQLRERTQGEFPVYVNNEGLELTDDEMFNYPIIYLTSHYEILFSNEEVENLRKYLDRGGTLWLDDCTGSGPFLDSLGANIQRIIPGGELQLMRLGQERYKDFFNMVYEISELPDYKPQRRQPFQVAYYKDRPAIIVSPNDYGCSWEVSSPPTALTPLGGPGHGDDTPTEQRRREETYQLCINWLFYTLCH